MQIDLPEVMAEVREAFERYERALVTNDVAALDGFFRDDARTMRYGVGENLYGYRSRSRPSVPRAHRSAWRARAPRRSSPRIGRDFAVASTLFHRTAWQGRTADADLGAFPGRLARGCGARERHRCPRIVTERPWQTRSVQRRSAHGYRWPACRLRRRPRPGPRGRAGVRRHRQVWTTPAFSSRSPIASRCARRRRSSAASIPTAKPLWGIPFAVKDNIDVAGLPTTAASPTFAYTPNANAHVVERLLAAGALMIGKTNLDQFATGLVGVRTPYPVPLQRHRSQHRAGRIELRLGGGGGARAGGLRARHRHGGLGTRAGRAQQHRRAEAVGRRRLDHAAWCRPAGRSTVSRCSR